MTNEHTSTFILTRTEKGRPVYLTWTGTKSQSWMSAQQYETELAAREAARTANRDRESGENWAVVPCPR